MQEYRTQVAKKTHLTAQTVELELELTEPKGMAFVPGQFVQFKVGEVWRSYSITSLPERVPSLTFCIGLIPGGLGSAFIERLAQGDEVTVRGPSGVFVLDDFSRPACFVATGVGVAPFLSIIPDALSRGYAQPLTLVFGVRSQADAFYFDRLGELERRYKNFQFVPTLSQPRGDWPGAVGRVTAYLEAAVGSLSGRVFFICGGMAMVKDTRQLLLTLGCNPKDIKLELFSHHET